MRAPATVLLLSQLPPPYGGLTVHTARLRSMLEQRGWRVAVASLPPSRSPLPRRFRRTLLFWDQLRFLCGLPWLPGVLVHDHVSAYVLGLRSPVAIALQLALLLMLRLRRGPWVLSCGNGLLPGQLADAPAWLRRAVRALYRGVDFAIAKNRPILDAFEELGLGDRSRVVGTFLEPASVEPAAPLPAEVERFLAAHPKCVVTAGFRFEPLYHVDAVVRAVAALRAAPPPGTSAEQIGLVILGSQAEDAGGKPALDAALQETSSEAHVLILRDVDFALDVTARAAVFVRATDVDGDANTVKEAMLVGVPVIATDLPGRPPGLHLVPRARLDLLEPALREVLAHPDPDRIERNRAFVKEDIERNAGEILAIYERVLGG